MDLKRKITFSQSLEILCIFAMASILGYIAVFAICGNIDFNTWPIHTHIFAKLAVPIFSGITGVILFDMKGWLSGDSK